MPLLQPNEQLSTLTQHSIRILRLLGEGGQGEVHEVELDGKSYALKWYFPNQATPEQRDALKDLIQRGSPSPRFLWPMVLVEDAGRGSFGYLMGLREKRFGGLDELVVGRMKPVPSFRVLCRAAIELALGFRALHTKGLCYRDISFGNAFLDPLTGDVAICDNDNVCVNHAHRNVMIGTGPFMAPEIWREEADPSAATDRHSLAILMFYLFMRSHPLEGRREADINCWDQKAQRELYGTRSIFIFDPMDASNRPVPGLHDQALRNWDRYPAEFQQVFTRAFTEGLKNPEHRVTESEWIKAFSRLRDSIFRCQHCGAENYYDRARLAGGASLSCMNCRKPLQLPMRLRIGEQIVMLNTDTQLYPHHFGDELNFEQPVAEVSRHPKDPNRYGLRNLTQEHWAYPGSNGTTQQVAPGMNAPLIDGLVLHFGRMQGQIKA